MEVHQLAKHIFTIPQAFTTEECTEFIQMSEKMGYTNAPITTAWGPVMSPQIRNNRRVVFDDAELANKIWARIEPHIPPNLENRKALGINERFRFYRYDPEQRFAPHSDGYFERANGERSMLTILIYLNEGFQGGETRFINPLDGDKIVNPEEGLVLIFKHNLLHEGVAVTEGRKYVLRSDIMYSSL